MPLIKNSAHNRLPARLPLVICALLLQSGCSLFGIRSTEEAPYSVLEEQGQYQIRQYQSLLIATTIVDTDFDEAGKQAFRRLFNYISGDNRADREIAMTAPVLAAEYPTTENAATDGERIKMTAPVFVGDTIYAESEVLEVRESRSRPGQGIVKVRTTGRKADGTEFMTFERAFLVPKREAGVHAY